MLGVDSVERSHRTYFFVYSRRIPWPVYPVNKETPQDQHTINEYATHATA